MQSFSKIREPFCPPPHPPTRAGALAGAGLALDPEGEKSVLIQPSSFRIEKKYLKRP